MQKYNKQKKQVVERVIPLPFDSDYPRRCERHVSRHRDLVPRQYLELEHAFYKYYHLKRDIQQFKSLQSKLDVSAAKLDFIWFFFSRFVSKIDKASGSKIAKLMAVINMQR